MIDLQPIWLSIKLSFVTTFILFFIAIPIAYWLAYSKWKIKFVIEAIVTLPMILPPSVLGFYMLLLFSPAHGLGKFLDQRFHTRLVFSFEGLVVASVIYSLPFMVNPILSGLRSLPHSLKEASQTMGRSSYATLTRILLPNIRPSILTAIVLAFAHTMGEFGVVMMIGGSIPGETRVAALAIFDEMQATHYAEANRYALILFAIAFVILITVYWINHRLNKLNTLP